MASEAFPALPYVGVRYTYSRPRRVDRPGDAGALYRPATQTLVDAGFFKLDPLVGPTVLDGIYRTVAAARCGQVVQTAFAPGADPRLDALFERLASLTNDAAWSPAPEGVAPARIPTLRLRTDGPEG